VSTANLDQLVNSKSKHTKSLLNRIKDSKHKIELEKSKRSVKEKKKLLGESARKIKNVDDS